MRGTAILLLLLAATACQSVCALRVEEEPVYDLETEDSSFENEDDSADFAAGMSEPEETDDAETDDESEMFSAEKPELSDEEEENSNENEEGDEEAEKLSNTNNAATEFWHVEDDAEEDLEENAFGETADEAESDELEESDDPEDTASLTAPAGVDATVVDLLNKMMDGSVKLALAYADDFNQSKAHDQDKVDDKTTKMAQYKQAIGDLRAVKKGLWQKRREYHQLSRKCKKLAEIATQKSQLLGSIDNKLRDLQEVRAQTGHTVAIAKKQAQLARMVADLAEGDETIDVEGLARPTEAFSARKQQISAAIADIRTRSVQATDNCTAEVMAMSDQLQSMKDDFTDMLPNVRDDRHVALHASKALYAADLRVRIMRLVSRSTRNLAAQQNAIATEIVNRMAQFPQTTAAANARIHKLLKKLRRAKKSNACVTELNKCTYDLGTLNGRNHIHSPPSFLSTPAVACHTALHRCHKAVKAALDQNLAKHHH